MRLLIKLSDSVGIPALLSVCPRRTLFPVLFTLALLASLTLPQVSHAQGSLPGAPANPMALGGPSSVTLSWDDPADDSITEHQYYQAQVAKLVHPDLTYDDRFGWSVAVDGDVAVVGAPGDELEHGLPGAAYVFTRQSGVWTRVAELTASDGSNGDRFGVSVAVAGDTIVISAKRHGVDDVQHGAVYVFTKPASGWADATETAKLAASDGADEDRFGAKVALAGNTIVVGAPHDDDEGDEDEDQEDNVASVGSAYVYVKPDSGWTDATEDAKLTASDGDEYHQFGKSVATDGATVVAGAPKSFSEENPPGVAYVFERPSDGWADATETAQLTASDGHDFDFFGESVGVDGDTIVVGAPLNELDDHPSGSAYVFVRPEDGWATADETGKLTASDGELNNQFGFSVAVSGDYIVVGNVGDGEVRTRGGAAYLYAEPAAGWADAVETAKLTPPNASTDYRVGYSVAVDADADTVFAGSLSLSAYSYQISAWTPIPDSGHGEANATSYTVSGLTNGLDYAYRVRAVNGAGRGQASDSVEATPGTPTQPVGLTATPDANSVILNWSAASAYEIITRYEFRGDGSGRGWQDIPGSDATTTSYTVTGLTNGQSYTFQVRAVNPVGTGPASDRVTATPQFLVTISVSDSTPVVGQRITLTANVESGITVASYQWDRRFGDGTWREDGPPRKSKGVEFDVNRTAVYRAVATLSTGRTVRSEPVTLTWRKFSRITVSNSSPARGEPVTWTAQLRGGDCSSMDYAWYQVGVNGAGSSVEGASSDTITEMFFQAEPRTYYVDVTCSDSEGNGVTYTSDRVTATATDEIWPYATITSNDDDNVVPVGTQVVLTSNLERRHPPLNWRVTWERRFGNGEWREVVDKPGSARFRRTFDSPGSRTYRSSIYIIQLDDTVKSDPITVTWTE